MGNITLTSKLSEKFYFKTQLLFIRSYAIFKNEQRKKREHNLSNPLYFLTSC